MSKITEMQMKIAELLQANEAAMTLVEQLTTERDALAATAEALRSDVEYIKGKLHILKAGVYVRRDTDKAYARCESALSKTPQQHLAEVRAQAVQEFAKYIDDSDGLNFGDSNFVLEEAAQYADSIRRGEVG